MRRTEVEITGERRVLVMNEIQGARLGSLGGVGRICQVISCVSGLHLMLLVCKAKCRGGCVAQASAREFACSMDK